MTRDDLDALKRLLDTPAGALYLEKGGGAIVDTGIEQTLFLNAKVDEIIDRPSDAPAPEPAPPSQPDPDSHHGKAMRWMQLLDTEWQQAFDDMAKRMRDSMYAYSQQNPDLFSTEDAQRVVDAWHNEVRIGDLEQIAGNIIAGQLSADELDTLLDTFSAPDYSAALRARARADRAFGDAAGQFVLEQIMPGLSTDILRLLSDSD